MILQTGEKVASSEKVTREKSSGNQPYLEKGCKRGPVRRISIHEEMKTGPEPDNSAKKRGGRHQKVGLLRESTIHRKS